MFCILIVTVPPPLVEAGALAGEDADPALEVLLLLEPQPAARTLVPEVSSRGRQVLSSRPGLPPGATAFWALFP